ncbi:MAG: helix-turn-helix transcriptional regulator [Okeania sp. SIO3B3]|nr:helix-turn-helix transcriptional regulator [Okeania sp. SIO3B3]
MPFAEKIRQLRKEKKWSQDTLAHKIEIHGRHVSKYEAGQALPNADTLIRIADVLDVSIDYLLRDTDENENPASKIKDKFLLKEFEAVDQMSEKDKEVIKTLIDAFIKKRTIEDLMDNGKNPIIEKAQVG